MESPIRIQRSIQHKQVIPNGLPIIYVGNPSKWGSPFILTRGKIELNSSEKLLKIKSGDDSVFSVRNGDAKKLVLFYKVLVTGNFYPGDYEICYEEIQQIHHYVKIFRKNNLEELRGKNLSCFCALHCACHADLLLELANK